VGPQPVRLGLLHLLRQFFLGLPREVFEAARVDGARYLRLFRRIALPLTTPALIVTFVFEFRASWTDLIRPLIYLPYNSLFTLPRGLEVILDQFGQGGEQQVGESPPPAGRVDRMMTLV
jgi:multiple sugar transport system permease protein